MKLKAPYIALAALLIMSSASLAEHTTGYHRPQTEAENALEKILQLNNNKERDLYNIIFNYPTRNKEYEENTRGLFTENFLQKAEKKEKELIRKSCGNVVPADGQPCDAIRSINPIACAQDILETYYYQTIYHDDALAIVRYGWPTDNGNYTAGPEYKFLFINGLWKMDEATCEKDAHP